MATVATPYGVALGLSPPGLKTRTRSTRVSTRVKTNNFVSTLGKPLTHQQCFAKVASSLSKGRRGGGSMFAQCSKIDEIFTIAAIINGITLVGVAVGFVLLRIEAFVEESD